MIKPTEKRCIQWWLIALVLHWIPTLAMAAVYLNDLCTEPLALFLLLYVVIVAAQSIYAWIPGKTTRRRRVLLHMWVTVATNLFWFLTGLDLALVSDVERCPALLEDDYEWYAILGVVAFFKVMQFIPIGQTNRSTSAAKTFDAAKMARVLWYMTQFGILVTFFWLFETTTFTSRHLYRINCAFKTTSFLRVVVLFNMLDVFCTFVEDVVYDAFRKRHLDFILEMMMLTMVGVRWLVLELQSKDFCSVALQAYSWWICIVIGVGSLVTFVRVVSRLLASKQSKRLVK